MPFPRISVSNITAAIRDFNEFQKLSDVWIIIDADVFSNFMLLVDTSWSMMLGASTTTN